MLTMHRLRFNGRDLIGEAKQLLGTPHADKFDLVFGLFFLAWILRYF